MEQNNNALRQVLEDLAKHPGQKQRAAVAAELLKARILAPAMWDKAPVPDGTGNLVFPPETNVSLMVQQQADRKKFFPFFTSQEALAAWNPKVQCLVLTFDQFLPFITMAGTSIDGVLMDAGDLDVILNRDFITTLAKVHDRGMKATRISKGDKVTVKEPGEDAKYLGSVLSKTAEEMEEIRFLVLKERLMPDKSSHWLIIVDSEKDDPELLSRLAKEGMRLANGKDLEFMFADTEIGSRIAADSKKLYERKTH